MTPLRFGTTIGNTIPMEQLPGIDLDNLDVPVDFIANPQVLPVVEPMLEALRRVLISVGVDKSIADAAVARGKPSICSVMI